MKKNNTRKKIVIGIIGLIIMTLIMILIFAFHKEDEDKKKLAQIIKENESRTFDVNGQEAKYTLLKNKNGTVYGIQFKNPELMTEITTIRTGARENIKDYITEKGIYLFKEDALYKLRIKTVNDISMVSDAFRVVIQETIED